MTALYTHICRVGWSYVLLHLDINLGTVDILPAWVGYLIILRSLPVLGKQRSSALLLKPFSWLLLFTSLADWLAKIIGSSLQQMLIFDGLAFLLDLILVLVRLYFHFQLLTDIAVIAKQENYPYVKELLNVRLVYTISMTIVALPFWFDGDQYRGAIGIGIALINVVAAVMICRRLLRLGKWGLVGCEAPVGPDYTQSDTL